jgi:hypothetical protein
MCVLVIPNINWSDMIRIPWVRGVQMSKSKINKLARHLYTLIFSIIYVRIQKSPALLDLQSWLAIIS